MRWSTFALLALASLSFAAAQDWPQWRGPNRDGSAAGVKLPAQWPEKLTRKWQIAVGEGHSSPVTAAGRIYQFARTQDQETLAGIDPETGKILWKESYPAPYTMNPAATGHGKGPKSTPVVADGRVYTLGITGILSCFDAASGKLQWRKDFSKRFKTTSPLYGTAMSPLVDRGVLFVHAGGHDDGAFIAFDAATGAEKWNWRGDGPGYASPILVELGGERQIVTQTQSKIVGLSAASANLLWEMPLSTPYVQNIVTPVTAGDLMVFAGLGNPMIGVRPANLGGRWSMQKVWENREAEMYMNSPVAAKGALYGFAKRDRGRFFCLDPASGKMAWQAEPRAGDYASIVLAGDTLLMLTSDAELTVARATPQRFEALRKYSVADSATWAHVTPLANGVLIKDASSLALRTW
ncbi:MAG: PQQ-like beta-propeller repeat protein [Bryobacteraceae bacterium]|nr:PQQ-like beta-propeller repeat protein [Bryobacteraceae bacterium]